MSSPFGRGAVIYDDGNTSDTSSRHHRRRHGGRRGDSSDSESSDENSQVYRERRIENRRFCSGCEWWVWLVTVMMMFTVTGVLVACLFAPSLAISIVDTNMYIHKPRAVIREEIYEENRHVVDNELELDFRDREAALKKQQLRANNNNIAVPLGISSILVTQRAPETCSTFFPGDCADKWSRAELAHYAQLPRGIPIDSVFRGHVCAATCQTRAADSFDDDASSSYWRGVCTCTKVPII